MSEQTNIGWTDHTFNPWWGCEKVSPGCKNCYAEALSKRWGHENWGPNAPRRKLSEDYWNQPLKWNIEALKTGKRPLVFCGSMCDVFEDRPIPNEERRLLWSLIRITPHLTWQLLTKRPENIERFLPPDWGDGYPNVWLGTSVENQVCADNRIPNFRDIPASVRFLSLEPLLGPIDLKFSCFNGIDSFGSMPGINWVIVGGESGPGHRSCDLKWIADITQDCGRAGVPVFIKQDSGPKPGKQGAIGDAYWALKQFPPQPND